MHINVDEECRMLMWRATKFDYWITTHCYAKCLKSTAHHQLKSAESEIKINKQHYKCWSHAYCIVALVIDSHDTYICWQSARDHRSFVHIVWTATSFCRPSIRWTMDGALARDIVTFTQHHRSVFWCVRCFCYRWLQQNIIFIIITLYIWI